MKKCKQGYYYCYDDKKCKKIPSGYRVGLGGWLRKEKEEEKSEDNGETESKKNGNGNGGNADGGAVSEGWSEKYKKSIDCKNPKGFSQRAHCQGRKKVNEAKEKGDHEVSMAQTQLKKSEENIKKLRKALGTKEKDIPAWVQAKITNIEHGTDAASSYMDEGKRDGKSAKDKGYSLRDWFAGGGWVQTGGKYDGKPCAKQPGQKTKPFCRDADDRASMSKKERNRRAAKKRKEDPNPNRKGKAKMVSASYSNWRAELEQLDEIAPAIAAGAALGIGAGGMYIINKLRQQKKKSDQGQGDGGLVDRLNKRKQMLQQLGNSYQPEGELIDEKCWDGYEQKGMKKKGKKVVPNCVPVGEEVVSEEGKKDACYKKVKERYDVWPSAYASGALVKCREVGAANWGNKTKKENFSDWRSDILLSEAGFKDMGPEDFKRYLDSLNSDEARNIARKAYAKKNPVGSKRTSPSMDVKASSPKPSSGGVQSPNIKRDAKWNKGQNFTDPRAQKVYDHMSRTRVDAAAETAAAKASKTAAQARRAARGGVGKRVIGAIGKSLKRNKYGLAATGAALGAAYVLGKVQNSFSRAPKNESVSIENSDGKTFAEVIDIIGPAQMQTATNQKGVWAGTTQLSNWRDELSEDWQKANRKDGVDGMSQSSVDAYKRENPGSKLKTAVTGKVKKGSKDAKRRKSFCDRSDGQRKMHNIDCSKTPDKKICKARRRWKC